MLESALRIAEKAHAGQRRKWATMPTPYIVHPLRVSTQVAKLERTTDEDIAAALLHDVLEDGGRQWEVDIRQQCGEDVYSLVNELTFPHDMQGWNDLSRAEKNIVKEAQLRRMSLRARRIKLVDRWDNLGDMATAPVNFLAKYIPESKTLLEICGEADPFMARELEGRIREAMQWMTPKS